MQVIVRELRRGGKVTRRYLADMLEVHPRTIQRDLDFMRERQGYVIDYEPDSRSYRLVSEPDGGAALPVTDGELMALLVARKAIEQYKGTPYEAQLASAFGKLLRVLREPGCSVRLDDLVSFHNTGVSQQEVVVFRDLTRALLERREVQFLYRKPQDAEPSERVVQPLHLSCREDSWYVVGYDMGRHAIRTFAVNRICELRVLERCFIRPANFSPEAYFGNAFGVFVNDGAVDVRLRFSPEVAPYVRERFWHASQDITERGDGSVDFHMRIAESVELERWVCSWLGEVEVLEPERLRSRIATIGGRIEKRNSGEPSPCGSKTSP